MFTTTAKIDTIGSDGKRSLPTDGGVTCFWCLSDTLCNSPMIVLGLRPYITQYDTFAGGGFASIFGENA